jgi:2-dehydropantoate 2-reductase
MNICVVGAGAIGGWITARLALSGYDVTLIARGATLDEIDAEGLRLTDRGETSCVGIATTADPATLPVQDIVVIALKAPALSKVAPELVPIIASDTRILPMVNGVPWWFTKETLWSVDPHLAIGDSLPLKQVVGSVVHASCLRSAPNHVVVKHADKLIFGEPAGGSSERVKALSALFANAGIHCEASDNVRRAIWYKLWGNATINPMSALTRATADKLLDDPDIRGMMAEAMDELAAVGAAIGCPIRESADDRMGVTERLGAFKSSMLQDVEAGRPIELEALLGAPREIAARVRVPTPQLDRIYALTRLMSENLGLR